MGDSGYNPHPNALRCTNGDIRFTDYNIDGAAVDFYFYFAIEMSDKLIKSDASPVLGPVQVINTRPAKKPNLKRVTSRLGNASGSIQTAVCFNLESYVESEGITQVDIYRATDPLDAITTRTMIKAASIDVSSGMSSADICDTFDGLAYPLYGEDLYYRLVALREVTLEDNTTTEMIPSQASDIVRTSIADQVNPIAPIILSENGTTTATELQNVILKWTQQCYNGTYSLQKLNDSGNWVEILKVTSNDSVIQYPPLDGGGLPDFTNYPETDSLVRDDDGEPIYHKFRVQIENSSGLFNSSDKVKALALGCIDLSELSDVLTIEDNFGLSTTNFVNQSAASNNNPGHLKFTLNLPSALPAGHSSFTECSITVKDNLGNEHTENITTSGSNIQFDNLEGNLDMVTSGITYTIVCVLKTNYCTDGYKRTMKLVYTA